MASTQEMEELLVLYGALTTDGLVLHKDGTIIFCNHQYAKMFGREREELVGTSSFDVIERADRERIKVLVLSGDEASYEGLGTKKDGKVFPFRGRGKNIPWNGGMARIGFIKDISDEKRVASIVSALSEVLPPILQNQTGGPRLLRERRRNGNMSWVRPLIFAAFGFTFTVLVFSAWIQHDLSRAISINNEQIGILREQVSTLKVSVEKLITYPVKNQNHQ